jgi:hypothetical protein
MVQPQVTLSWSKATRTRRQSLFFRQLKEKRLRAKEKATIQQLQGSNITLCHPIG